MPDTTSIPLVETITHQPKTKWDKSTTTLIINGRSRYSDSAVATISIREHNSYQEPLLILHGATIERDKDTFRIGSRHITATDVEHDAAYVALLEGAGQLSLDSMLGASMQFTGVLLKASFYTTDPLQEPEHAQKQNGGFCNAEWCETKGHPFLSFTAPSQRWEPALYSIEVTFR